MDRRQLLRVAAFLILATHFSVNAGVMSVGAAANEACLPSDSILGECAGAGISDGQIDVYRERTSPGSTGGPRAGSSTGHRPTAAEERLAREQAGGRPEFWVVYTPPPGAPAVTLNDIASFRPAVGTSHMEPNGWTVVGLHTNFYSDVGTHVVDGTLLGGAASVRFTPRSWQWDFGDGTVRDSRTPGSSWADLGVPEFEETATSHVYAAAVTATIQLRIGFGAEYRVGGGAWTPIDGTLTVPAAPISVTAGGAKTVLVGRDCASNPAGPGC